MKMTLRRHALALTLGGLALLGLTAHAVRAQDAEPTKPISLNLRNVPIQTALQLLFTGAGIRNTSIDSDVQGFANINVNEVPFNLALRTLLSSVNPPLSYDRTGGIYHVSVQRAVVAPPVVINPPPAVDTTSGGNPSTDNQPKRFYRIPIDKYDAFYIAQLLGAKGIIQVGVNDVIPANGGSGSGGTNGGNRGFGGGSFGNSGGFGSSGPNISTVGSGSFGSGSFGSGSFGSGRRPY